MANTSLEVLLAKLEATRYSFNPGDGKKVEELLRILNTARFPAPSLLIRFHEAVLFIRAFPQNAAVLRRTEHILNRFDERVEPLRKAGADMDEFDTFEHSGISGTEMEDTLSFDVARWLVRELPYQVEIAWDNYEPGRELGTTGPRFMPLLEDDAFVEADTPFRRWLEAAGGQRTAPADSRSDLRAITPRTGYLGPATAKRRKGTAHGASRAYDTEFTQPQRGERKTVTPVNNSATPAWLIDRFDRLPLPPQQKAELYESLRIPLRWRLGNERLTRTRNWQSSRKVFYHRGPFISRSRISLAGELAKRPPEFTRLSLREGERITDMIREIMLVRYRELYGTTLADPRSVVRVDLQKAPKGAPSLPRSLRQSRGVEIYLWNLPPERRLPLRAYVAGFTLKNGVPINYIEAIALCEWMEVGFNTFYTFRGGEAGWIYAQVLRSLCASMGTKVVSVYPYQLGHDNDEAIESGAFWFYRKLGFRPGRADLLKLAESEERRIAADPKYRTPTRTLKRLAAGHVFYELPGSEIGAWDTFSTRNIGLRVNRRMAQEFGGNSTRMLEHSRHALQRVLGVNTQRWPVLEQAAFDNFAFVLAQHDEMRTWSETEKEDLVQLIRAKGMPDELRYLHLTRQHARLREALLKLGSGGASM